MIHKLQLKIPKLSLNLLPNANDMKIFASNYTIQQWKELTNHKSFLRIFSENLDEAKKEAEKILEIQTVSKKLDLPVG